MIEISNLTKSYEKGKEVLKGVSLSIPNGTVFGLVGINGAGKSTLLRLIAGVLKGDGGQVSIDGKNVYENEAVKSGVFFLPDDPFYTHNVSADGLAALYQAVYPFDEGIYKEYLEKFALNSKSPIRNFSKGMKRQVFVALALAISPKYLLLDEAFDGLDPLARMVFKKGLMRLVQERGSTVIISSHSLRELEDVCDGYGILDHGTITSSGDLGSDTLRLHKFQAAFPEKISEEALGFPVLSFEQTGKVVRVIARGDGAEMLEKLQALAPIFVEEIEVDFEELFIGEVESRGYLK